LNIDNWTREREDWFKVEKIPDSFLPEAVFIAEGGAQRRRSSVISVRELMGMEDGNEKHGATRVHPEEAS